MISFASIPLDIRSPGQFVEVDTSKAQSGLPAAQTKILVVGQRLAAGLVPAGQLTRIVSPAQGAQAFGRGSMLAQMLAGLTGVNQTTETWAIALDDLQAGVVATKTITLTGPASVAGTLPLRIANVAVTVGVASGDTATTVAANVASAVNALPDLPVTATSAAGVVTLTARHKGVAHNDVDVRFAYFQGEAIPAGLTAVVAVGVTGTGNPDVSAVWAAIGDAKYSTFIIPWTDAATLSSVEAEMLRRFGPMLQNDGCAYFSTIQSMSAAATLGTSRNSGLTSILPIRGGLTPPWVAAAIYGGVIAYYGAIDPARQFATLPLTGIGAPAQGDRWTRTERDNLLRDGMSTSKVDASGIVTIDRAITTWQTDSYGYPSTAFLDVTTVLTVSYLRYSMRQRIAQKFPRMKLASDGNAFGAGQAIVTPTIIRAELIALAKDWVTAGLIEDIDQFKRDLVVERDANDPNRVNALIPPNIVNNFMIFAASVQFLL